MSTTNKTSAVNPGWKTTEFWLTAGMVLCSLLWGADVLNPEGTTGIDRVFGFVAAALGALGYTVSRGMAKSGAKK